MNRLRLLGLFAVMIMCVGCSDEETTTTNQTESVVEDTSSTIDEDDTTKDDTTKNEDDTTVDTETTASDSDATDENIESSTYDTVSDDETTAEDAETTSKDEQESQTTTKPKVEKETTTKPKVETQTTTKPKEEKPTTAPSTSEDDFTVLVKNIVKKIVKSDMTEFQKAFVIHDYITYNVDYDYDNYLAHTIPRESYTAQGALVKGWAVCAGYAEAFYELAKEAGLEVMYVSGVADNGSGKYEGHAWNQVKIDGTWYNVDTTWDDPTYKGKDPNNHSSNRYDYFLISDATLEKDHKSDRSMVSCPEDYSLSAIAKEQIKDKENVIFLEREEDFNDKVIEMMKKGYESFEVYIIYDEDVMYDKIFLIPEKIYNISLETRMPYFNDSTSMPGNGLCIHHINKRVDTHCVTTKEELKNVLNTYKDKLDKLTIWYYDDELIPGDEYFQLSGILLSTGHNVELYGCSEVKNGRVEMNVRKSEKEVIDSLEDFKKLFNKYSIEQVLSMQVIYINDDKTNREIEEYITDCLVEKGYFAYWISIDISYGVTYIGPLSELKKVIYLDNPDQIVNYASEIKPGVDTDFVIKISEDESFDVYERISSNLSSVIEQGLCISYNYFGGYMNYMISIE